MTFSEKMKKLRKEKRESQKQASNGMGIAISSLRNYENGRFPDTVQLKIIKEYYGVTYEYLLDDECENKKNDNLEIGELLKLSDKSIEKINLCKENYKCLNYFIEKVDLVYFIDSLRNYSTISKLIETDLFRLIYIYDLTEYIKDRIENSKQEDLEDYFKECRCSVERIVDFANTGKNRYFIPSNSVYELFKDKYYELENAIFTKQRNINTELFDNFNIILDDFCDLHEEVLAIMQQYRKVAHFEISETIDNLLKSFEHEIGIDHYSQILGKYIKYINKD